MGGLLALALCLSRVLILTLLLFIPRTVVILLIVRLLEVLLNDMQLLFALFAEYVR